MDFSVAVRLLKNGVSEKSSSQIWADLGAGKGLFTQALASLMPDKSIIYAIDKDAGAIGQIPDELDQVTIKKIKNDFSKQEIKDGPFDGILMANSLHYVLDQATMLTRLAKLLKPDGRLILIEYDMNTPNPWVPYPIGYGKLTKLINSTDFKSVTRLGETPSVYNRADIYSVMLTQNQG